MRHTESFEALADTLKIAVATLRDANVPFVLGGSLAAWARGGPEPQNDLDPDGQAARRGGGVADAHRRRNAGGATA
jgi:hypothetical protein